MPDFQRAEHYILNYPYILNDRIFRVEGFYKKYSALVTTRNTLQNDGTGYAQGLELFYRDKKTFKGVDFWLSYSYLDTKRRFQWYPLEAQPTFAANHVATLVAKKYIFKIRTSVGMTYNYSTGRPYYNPNRPLTEFLVDRTPAYNSLSVNASYLTTTRNPVSSAPQRRGPGPNERKIRAGHGKESAGPGYAEISGRLAGQIQCF